MIERHPLTTILIVFLAIALSACGSVYDEATTSPTITMDDFNFDPNSITVPADEEITITIINNGTVEHKWAVMTKPVESPFDAWDEANIFFAIEVEAGETTTANFDSPAAAGEYEMVCVIPGQPDIGLFGKIIVVQP